MEGTSSRDMARRPNVIRRIEADGKNVNHGNYVNAIRHFSIINPILPITPMLIGDSSTADHTRRHLHPLFPFRPFCPLIDPGS